jgi:hypothetical protein
MSNSILLYTRLNISRKRHSGQGNARLEFLAVVNKNNLVCEATLCNLLLTDTVLPKRRQISTRLRSVTSQKMLIFIQGALINCMWHSK